MQPVSILTGEIKMKPIEIYHGGTEAVVFPEIRKTRYTKDFSWGFYCTKNYEQAYRPMWRMKA